MTQALAGALLVAWLLADGRPGVVMLLVGAGRGALAGGLTFLGARRRYRRLLGRLAQGVAAARANPAPHVLDGLKEGEGGAEAAPLVAELNRLAGSYRQALAEVVQTQEKLERARQAPRVEEHDRRLAPG